MGIQINLEVLGIEVIQTIQTAQHDVVLFQNKPSVVRVFLNPQGEMKLDFVTASLNATNIQMGISEVIETDGLRRIDGRLSRGLNEQRNDNLQTGISFHLPPHLSSASELELELIGVKSSGGRFSYSIDSSNSRRTVTLEPAPVFRVKAIGLLIHGDESASEKHRYNDRFQHLHSYLQRLFPVQIEWSDRIVTADPYFQPPLMSSFDSSPDIVWETKLNILHQHLMALRAIDMSNGQDHRTRYYSLLYAPKHRFSGAVSDVPENAHFAVVAAGPYEWDTFKYTGYYGAHELGHALGLLHPGYCRNQQIEDDEAHRKFPDGRLSDDEVYAVGYDSGDYRLGLSASLKPYWKHGELMTACSDTWISAHNYKKIFERLSSEEGLESLPTGEFVVVIGEYNLSDPGGDIKYMLPTDWSDNPILDEETSVEVVVLSRSGERLDSCFVPEKNSRAKDLPLSSGVFQVALKKSAGAHRIELRVHGRIVDSWQENDDGDLLKTVTDEGRYPISALASVTQRQLSVSYVVPKENFRRALILQVREYESSRWEAIAVSQDSSGEITIDPRFLTSIETLQIRMTMSTGFEMYNVFVKSVISLLGPVEGETK